MSTIVIARPARTAALIAAALSALACGGTGSLTAPTRVGAAVSAPSLQPLAPTIAVQGPRLSGYALASGRVADSLTAPVVR